MTDLVPAAPKPPRQMKQPRKDALREQLAAAKAENERLCGLINYMRQPWWQRLYLRVSRTQKETG